MDEPVTLENLARFSDDQLKQFIEERKLDVPALLDKLARKFMTVSIMQSDSTPLEQQATRLLTVSNTDITQQEFFLKNAVFLWSDPETRLLENKLWNFYINTALRNNPNRKQAILDSTLVKLTELYMKDRNQFMFAAIYTAMEKLIAQGAEISHAVVKHVSAIQANDDDFPLRGLIFRYVSQFAKCYFLLSLCANHLGPPMSLLPAEIIFMIAKKSIGYADKVSATMQEENKKIESEIRSGYSDYWRDMRERADVVAAMVARDQRGRRTHAEEAAQAWLRTQVRKK